MKHKPQEAADFLQCLGGENFIFQTFDDSEQKRKSLSRVLHGTFEQHKDELIKVNNNGAGVFVQVNRGNGRGKDYIKGINALFVDLDEPETAIESLKSIQKYMPKPTIVINSSKGKYHIYWKVLDCKLGDFRKMQVSLALTFNTDVNVKNLDRVMRLPGFIHRKYDPVLSKIIQKFETVHTVDQLFKAAAQAPVLTPTTSAAAEVQSDLLKKDVFGLDIGSDYEVPDSVQAGGRNYSLIQYVGHLTGTGIRDEQEAQDLIRKQNNKFAEPLLESELQATIFQSLAKYIVEANVADELKAQQALANNNPSVPPAPKKETKLETVPTPPKNAAHPSTALEMLLHRYVLIERGSQVLDTYASGEYRISLHSEFKLKMKNLSTPKNDPAARWLADPERKTYRDIIWYPSDVEVIKDDVYEFYNLYRQPTVNPVEKEDFDINRLDIFFEHMEFLFPVKEDREFFYNWFAKTVIAPTVRILWAPLLISEEGAGKGFIYEVLSELLGTENSANIMMASIESQFNSYMMCSSIVLIDEVSKPKSDATVDKMKAYITQPTLMINTKGVTEKKYPIYANVIMFSNKDDAADIKDKDRRFWVHKITGVKPSSYYDRIFGWFKHETKTTKKIYNDNLNHLMRWCLERDLSKFNSNHRPPDTASKRGMVLESRSNLDIELCDAIEHRDGPFAADILPLKTIKDYMAMVTGRDLTISEERQIPKILNKFSSKEFCGEALHSIDKNIPTRGRARCIRNVKHWANQKRDNMHHEFTRALQLHLKVQDVLPPILELVEGDNDAKSSKP